MNNLYFFHESLFQALGWTIIHSIWQIALIGLLIKAGMWIFKKHAPEVRYHLLMAGILCIVLTTGFTFYKMVDNPVDHLVYGEVKISEDIMPATQLPDRVQPTLVAFDRSLVENALLFVQNNTHLITLFWLIGFLFFSVRFAGGYWYLSRIRRTAVPVNKKIHELSSGISSKFNLKKYVAVFESVTVKVPIVFGYIKPVIILPAGLATSIPFNQLEAILTHELAHIKRNDFIVNILRSLLEAVFFYHPVFWWIGKQLDNERENCCDDLTIALCENETALQEALLNIELHNQKLQHIAAALYKNKFQLLNRIKRMKSKNNLNHGNRNTLAGLLILPAMVIIFSLSSAFVPREADLPHLSVQNNPAIPSNMDINTAATEPVNLKQNAPVISEPPVETLTSDPAAIPDTNEIKYGSKIKTDEGYVLMEFDENMNLQNITRDGKELTGEEREKYEKIAATSKKAFDAQAMQKEKQAQMAELQEKLQEMQSRIQEAQNQYNDVMREYMERAAFSSDSLWTEAYARAFDHNLYFNLDSLSDYQFEMPDFEMPEIAMPELPEVYFDEQQLQQYYEQAQAQYKDVMKEYERQRQAGRDDYRMSEDVRAEERKARALERDARAMEQQSRNLQHRFKTELINDGIIDDWDDLKSFKLNDKKLEVNGEKQSKEKRDKYLKMYKEVTGKPLEGTLEINE